MTDSSSDSFSAVSDGTHWCQHCNGYGSSLKEPGDRCTRCGGTGLVAETDRAEQQLSGLEPGRLGRVE